MNRRTFALAAVTVSSLALLGACARKREEARCGLCGMKIDPASPWRAELLMNDGTAKPFDTPRCALTSLRRGAQAKGVRVQEFYDRTWLDGTAVEFVVGSDVLGPMGPDLVPVAKGRGEKFVRDHSAEKAVLLDAVTAPLLDDLK